MSHADSYCHRALPRWHTRFGQAVAEIGVPTIVDALKRADGKMAAAARDLGTTSRIIRYKVKNLDIDYRRYARKR